MLMSKELKRRQKNKNYKKQQSHKDYQTGKLNKITISNPGALIII